MEILLSAETLRKDTNVLGTVNAEGRNCMMVALDHNHGDIAKKLINDQDWK